MKKATRIISVLTLIFSLFIGLAFSAAEMVGATGTDNVTVTLHKKKMTDLPNPLIQNTGLEMAEFSGYDDMPNVEFTVYDVTSQFYALRAGNTNFDDALDTVAANPDTTHPKGTGITKVNGQVSFDLAAKSGGKDAIYVFVETNAPTGTTAADNLVLALPMYDADNILMENILLYPKNVVKADGSVTVTKLGTAHNEPLERVYFIITRELTEGEVEYRAATTNPTTGLYNWVKSNQQAEKFVTNAEGQFTIGNLEYGEYKLVEAQYPGHVAIIGDGVTPFTINASNKSIELTIMNDTIDIVKEHEGESTDYNVGDLIPYSLTFKIPVGIGYKNQYDRYYHTYLLIRDRPDAGLYFHNAAPQDANGLKVHVGTQEIIVEPEWLVPTNNGFSLTIPISAVENYGGQELKVSYNMYLDGKAIPDVGYKNLGSINTGKLADNDTGPEIFTGGYKFKKVDANFDTKNTLAGAEFVIRDADNSGAKYLHIHPTTNAISWVSTLAEAKVFETETDGLINIAGLEYGTYYLEETKAPADYVLLENRIPFTISKDSYKETARLDVTNIREGRLPSTGGSGIYGILGIGVVLVASTGGYYVKRKREA